MIENLFYNELFASFELEVVTINFKKYVKLHDLAMISIEYNKWIREIDVYYTDFNWFNKYCIFFGEDGEIMIDLTVFFAIYLLADSKNFVYLVQREFEPGLNDEESKRLHEELSKCFNIAEDLILKYASHG